MAVGAKAQQRQVQPGGWAPAPSAPAGNRARPRRGPGPRRASGSRWRPVRRPDRAVSRVPSGSWTAGRSAAPTARRQRRPRACPVDAADQPRVERPRRRAAGQRDPKLTARGDGLRRRPRHVGGRGLDQIGQAVFHDDRGRRGSGRHGRNLPRAGGSCLGRLTMLGRPSRWGTLSNELAWRGLVQQTTAENMAEVLGKPLAVYTGFDPTATSLHAGNLVPLMLLTHLRRHGHKVLPLVGGATGMIGDPSGKSSERTLLDSEKVRENTAKIRAQIEKFFANGRGAAGAGGRQPGLARPGAAARVSARRRQALRRQPDDPARFGQAAVRDARERASRTPSFRTCCCRPTTSTSCNRRLGCRMQCGASDQWGNIVSGVDLVPAAGRRDGPRAHHAAADRRGGAKYGKSEKGAVYLDRKLTSPYSFYQFWFNTRRRQRRAVSALADAARRARRSRRSKARSARGRGRRSARWPRTSPAACTATPSWAGGARHRGAVRRRRPARDRRRPAGRGAGSAAPAITVARARFDGEGALLVELLAEVGACPSKSDARRQLAAGAIAVNGTPLAGASETTRVTARELIDGRLVVLRRGKRNNFIVRAAG